MDMESGSAGTLRFGTQMPFLFPGWSLANARQVLAAYIFIIALSVVRVMISSWQLAQHKRTQQAHADAPADAVVIVRHHHQRWDRALRLGAAFVMAWLSVFSMLVVMTFDIGFILCLIGTDLALKMMLSAVGKLPDGAIAHADFHHLESAV